MYIDFLDRIPILHHYACARAYTRARAHMSMSLDTYWQLVVISHKAMKWPISVRCAAWRARASLADLEI